MISPLSFLFLSFSLSSLPQQPRERKRKQEEELVLRWSKYINKNNNQNINSSIKATHNLRPKKSRQQTRRGEKKTSWIFWNPKEEERYTFWLFSTHENGSPSAAAAGATNKEMIMN
jgi:uncharacterized protein YcaQ